MSDVKLEDQPLKEIKEEGDLTLKNLNEVVEADYQYLPIES